MIRKADHPCVVEEPAVRRQRKSRRACPISRVPLRESLPWAKSDGWALPPARSL